MNPNDGARSPREPDQGSRPPSLINTGRPFAPQNNPTFLPQQPSRLNMLSGLLMNNPPMSMPFLFQQSFPHQLLPNATMLRNEQRELAPSFVPSPLGPFLFASTTAAPATHTSDDSPQTTAGDDSSSTGDQATSNQETGGGSSSDSSSSGNKTKNNKNNASNKKRVRQSSNGGEKKKKKYQQNRSVSCSTGSNSSEDDQTTAPGLRGEQRLSIHFESFGDVGDGSETYGKSGSFLIPNGLKGSHFAYNQPWEFEVTHVSETVKPMRIRWCISNLATFQVYERTETIEEAKRRQLRGWTISNEVFREAMERRVQDLEKTLTEEENSTRVANIESLIKSLRPKKFSEGLLVFGLQHKIVQDKMQLALKAKTQQASSSSTSNDAERGEEGSSSSSSL